MREKFVATLQSQDVVQFFGGLQGFFEGEKLFFVVYLVDLTAKYFGVFSVEVKQGVFDAGDFLFDFFDGFEKLVVAVDFVAQFFGKFVPIGAVGFVEFFLNVGKIDDVTVAVRFVGAVDAGQGLQKIVGFD